MDVKNAANKSWIYFRIKQCAINIIEYRPNFLRKKFSSIKEFMNHTNKAFPKINNTFMLYIFARTWKKLFIYK